MRRAVVQLDELTPPRCRGLVAALPPGQEGKRAKSLDAQRQPLSTSCGEPEIVRCRFRPLALHECQRTLKRLLGPLVETGVAIDASEGKRFACTGRGFGSFLYQQKKSAP